MGFALILSILLMIIGVWLLCYNIKYNASVVKRELEVEKHIVSLDEREAKLKEDFLAIVEMEKQAKEIKCSYVVTDADEMKYDSEATIRSHAVEHLTKTLATDISYKFPPKESVTEDGRKVYSYKLKVYE